MQSAGFSIASSQIRHGSLSYVSSVTTATPAKRITFYKSGDTQFSGIRMPIHKRSFKCFDALLDDLSQKMPLPFGVRTITTPRGTHAIQSLEQLQDGACYLCSDRHYVKPIDMEVAGKQPAVWHHNFPFNTPRKPSRPDEPPTGHYSHHYHRHPKRIVLVKNSDPAVRRSIALSRKRARSLRVFMDEISELMQSTVRKLYTLEGRKIDSMQSLMQCPSVLVCVGRESFNPLLLEHLRKNSEEKLPGIGARSHSSIYSEGHDSKKNVNFGLETKKSIIHPRSDSSNKSTRFSLSSEKSYPNGSSMTPGQLGCVTKEVVMNDDVEKRVLVNKDGSLSVEMKVRFRLVNDETLQWSTEIKKLPNESTNECSSLQEGDPHILQDKVEYSEPGSNTECEAEEACSPKCHQMDYLESYCQNCYSHNQGYDIWKNPLHRDDGASGIRSSSNSAASSDKTMHQKASVDSVYTFSRSSEEYTEQVKEKASCFQRTIEEGDTRIEYCSISRCCNQSEVSTSTTKCNEPIDTCERKTEKMFQNNERRKTDNAEADNLNKVTKVAEHLISSTSNSSIIQSFKKDKKVDYDDSSVSVSRAWCSEQDKLFACVYCYGCQGSQNLHSSSVAPKVSNCSADALKSKKHKNMYAAPEMSPEGHADNTDSARSSVSTVCSRSQCCRCSQHRDATTSLVESEMKSGLKERVQSAVFDDSKVSNKSQAITNSPRTLISDGGVQKACSKETKRGNRSISTRSINTRFSVMSTVCPCCGGCGRLTSTIPANVHDISVQVAEEDDELKPLGQRSSKLTRSEKSNKCTHCSQQKDSAILNTLQSNEPDQNKVDLKYACSQSELSDSSKHSTDSKQFNKSNQHACGRSCDAEMISENAAWDGVEGRNKSAMSVKSVGSAKSNNNMPDKLMTYRQENQTATQENITETENVMQNSDIDTEESVAMSTKSHSTKDFDKSQNVNNIQDTMTVSPQVSTSPITDNRHIKINSERLTIALSKSAKVSVKSSACSECDIESLLYLTDMTEVQETTQTTDDAKCSAENSLPVASPSPKSSITAKSNNQSSSIKSVYTKTSSKSTRHIKRHCSSSRCVQRVTNSPSVKSRSLASHGQLDEPLSPTSTASVSLGLGAEERSEDLNEKSMSNILQIFDKPSCFSEKNTYEPSALHDVISNSAIIETRESVRSALSTSLTVSDKSKLFNNKQNSCKDPEVILGGEFECFISTKSKTESQVMVQHLQNDGDHRVPSALSGSSEKSEKNSPSRNNSAIKINTNTEKGETIKDSSITGSSLKSSQNKISSEKAITRGAATSKGQGSKKKEKFSSNLDIKEAKKTHSNNTASVILLKTSKSDKKPQRKKYATKSEVSQICTTPNSKGNSALPHTPDLLMEKDSDAKPDSRKSRSNTSDKNYVLEEKQHVDSNCKNSREITITSQNNTEDHDKEPLMPSSLPSASPTDVVNNWLKNIPIDGPMYEMEDEIIDEHDESLLHKPAVKDNGCFQNEIGEHFEKPMKMIRSEEIDGPEGADPVTEVKNTLCDAKMACNETFQIIVANSDRSHVSSKITNRESLTNKCQSSIQVMKVLLSPKLDRCNSLPEVSPTYGRKLSTSAKGLLDCLANLQMIDPDPKIFDKYSEIISTLQSLWIDRPSETVQEKHSIKINSAEDEFNLRSSSGVDLSSGSIGSNKESISGGLEKLETAEGKATVIVEEETFPQNQGDVIKVGGCDSLSVTPENINTSLVSSEPITPDIAERVRCSPEHEQLNKEAQKDEGLKVTGDVLQTKEHITAIKEIASTFSMRTFENNGNVKSVTVNETVHPENNNSRTSQPDQKGQLTKRISQDPDPVWVLSLLKKLEKQFMSHYVNAIAEFKVRWDLNDNETLEIMISELKEEVHKRIQSTINRELQKIQSRAGKTPRPPISILSRDSTVQTEQRRRRLRVMQNKLINPSRGEYINSVSGTEFSDQRSEDEYCPCDACVKKKMTSRVVQCSEALSVAPVLKEFDLRKILQTKKDPPVTMPVQSNLDEQKDRNKDKTKDVKEDAVTTEQGVQACENQDKDIGVINAGGVRTVKEGPSKEHADEKLFDNNIDGADDGESETEKERHEVGEDLEGKYTDKKDNEIMNREDEQSEEETEEDTTLNEKVLMEKELAAERKKTESSDTEEGEGNSVEDKESNDERAEEEVSEGETNKQSEIRDAEEEERDEIEEKAEIPEEGEETENRTGEETQSAKDSNISWDESGDENSNETSDERTQDNAPAAAATAVAKPRKNEKAQIIEGEKAKEDGTTRTSEAKMSTENTVDENQSESIKEENEFGNEPHDSKGKTHIQKSTKKKDNMTSTGQVVSEEEDDGDIDGYETDVKHQTNIRAERIENQEEGSDRPSQTCDDESDCKLITQLTKTSVESQTGSLEHSKNITVKEKLRDVQSLIDCLNDS